MIINFKKCIFQVVTSVLSVFTQTGTQLQAKWILDELNAFIKTLDGKNSDIDK